MATAGYENIPIVVTETGWPSASTAGRGSSGDEKDANMEYAEMYLKGLVKHLKSSEGTPLRKEGAASVYVYELFDEEAEEGTQPPGRRWGILYPNLTKKYSIDFSGSSSRAGEAMAWMKILIEVALPSLALSLDFGSSFSFRYS